MFVESAKRNERDKNRKRLTTKQPKQDSYVDWLPGNLSLSNALQELLKFLRDSQSGYFCGVAKILYFPKNLAVIHVIS